MTSDTTLFMDLGFYYNLLTIIISVVALIYWIRLSKRIRVSEQNQKGWLWIFLSVLIILVLNLVNLLLSLLSGRLFWGDVKFVISPSILSFIGSVTQLVIALSISIGTYRLYESIRSQGDMKFLFVIDHVIEKSTGTKAMYELGPGTSYIVKEAGELLPSGFDVFADAVTHGIMGLCITRTFPQKIRDKYNLVKTPIIWLTKEKSIPESIHPADLTELSHMIKEFIVKGEDTIILLNGIEYLISYNSFEEILRMIQGLDDVIAQNKCRFLLTLDPSTVTEQQQHMLYSELKEFKF